MSRIQGILTGAVVAVLVAAGALTPASPVAATAPPGPDETSSAVVVPGNDPDNPAVPSDAEIAATVDPGEAVTVNVAVQLDDGNVRIESREAVGPTEAAAEIAEAAAEPDVVAADVAKPVQSFAGDPYRVEVNYFGFLFPGQYGLSMMCTDLDALVLNPNCNDYSYRYATGAGQVIAVLDEPVQVSHPDLAANTLGAISCLGNPCVAATYTAATAAQHGMHVAGIAAAVTDNGIGVAGQAKGAKILPISVLDKGGSGDTGMLARGIARATAANVDVINMSLGFYGTDETVRAAVNAALAANITLVAAAGNDGVAAQTTYPAAYPDVIGVGAVNQQFVAWTGSSRGSWVDIVAPGADFILSTWPSTNQCKASDGTVILTGYCYQIGTSMATPFISGAVAQMLERNPSLTPQQVFTYLTTNAFDLGGAGRDNTYGYGFPQLPKTLAAIPQLPTEPLRMSYAPGDRIVTVGFQPPLQPTNLPVLRYEYSINGGAWTTAANNRTKSPLTIDALTAGGTALVNGTSYSLRLRAVNAGGIGPPSAPLTVIPSAPVPTEFVSIDPQRVYNSLWPASSGVTVGPLAAAEGGRLISVKDARGATGAVTKANIVPAGATGVAYNVTVTGQTTSGYLSVAPGSVTTAPNSSTINWTRPLQTVANGFVTGIDGNRQIRAYVGGNGSTAVIIDIVGYYVPQAVAAANKSVFVPLASPTRVYQSIGWTNPALELGPIAAGESRVVSVADGRTNTGAIDPAKANVVPAGATGIAYNLTITGTTGGSGYLSVAPGNAATAPSVSTINWNTNSQTIANSTAVGISANREVKVFAGGGNPPDPRRTTQFIIDVVGYFIPAASLPPGVTGTKFVALPPLRSYFSIGDGDTLTAANSPRVTSAGLDRGVPTGSRAVAFNLTITGNYGSGYLTMTPGNITVPPLASTINWTSGNTTLANGSVVGIDDMRQVATFTGGSAGTNYLIDIAGYYQ